MIRLFSIIVFSIVFKLLPLGEVGLSDAGKIQDAKVEKIRLGDEVFRIPNKNVRFSWHPTKRLTWSDFRGMPDRSSKYAATANTGISHTYAINSRGYLIKKASKVYANFYPNLSWYVPKLINETTLAHEQTHFDISELHARILRQTIAEYRFTRNSKAEIQAIYQKIEKARKAMQVDFDRETKHSVDREKEQAWEANVAKLLYKYRHWAS
ncbi:MULTISPECIES: DUF922 domain-containing protein [unclassified Leeuwenhoekiella]|uniref:DUF922 domain-containing protein n=1 Tax=unclassified Leeuwenhoekiella TaxID=2615029 RepID=UPI000C4DA525|nr:MULTISPECIES: DUF922 domain-containing protein [unclassified Leeuwenhoekiella]MAW94014.1 DUF922 domain-containing protein [Leeuwenhoekiella sp.]MBA80947.1 DUF922 domain-containing protein [Leeuwenhoekiella sp.]